MNKPTERAAQQQDAADKRRAIGALRAPSLSRRLQLILVLCGRRVTRAVLRSVVAVTPFLAAGCMGLFMIGDGSLGVRGVVYRALPSERSSVKVDVESPLLADREPLAGCTVVLEPWTTRTRPRSAETRTLWT